MKINYAKELDELIAGLSAQGKTPTLLLHACCAPCSSAVLEQLSKYFSITLLYYNPNISPIEEYEKRLKELHRLVSAMPTENPLSIMPCGYDGEAFAQIAKGLEEAPEGGARCLLCYRLRLEETARLAKANGFDYFTTTLTISPLKSSAALNEIGKGAGEKWNIPHLPSDFKKKEGYKRSIELSKQYDLYRQDYCGCVYSKAQRLREKERKDQQCL